MKLLVVGSGGREHALVWKISQSPQVKKVYCAPGNAGIGESAELIAIGSDEIEKLGDFASREKIDLTVVGPELPLTLGIVDHFEARGMKIFGPNREAAKLEGSKAFTKQILAENGIPTASFRIFSDSRLAREFVRHCDLPCVVKADGLAGGKGVVVCLNHAEAESAIEEIMVRKVFGDAGERVVIEEFLRGEEASFMVLLDGAHYLPLASSQDHKRVFNGDKGPNTGGMGAYSPAPVLTAKVEGLVMSEILEPLVRGLKKRGISYRGLLYVGLMLTAEGPKVLEFNVRFGDPECQPVLMRLENDLVSLLECTMRGELDLVRAQWSTQTAVCVVLCSGGYPGAYAKGKTIRGLEKLQAWQNGFVFHCGTARAGEEWLTAGGRVLGVTALGRGIQKAVEEVYRAVREIEWESMHYRTDIARRALQ